MFLHLLDFFVILPTYLLLSIFIIYYLLHLSPKISLVFVNLLLIMVFILNFFPHNYTVTSQANHEILLQGFGGVDGLYSFSDLQIHNYYAPL